VAEGVLVGVGSGMVAETAGAGVAGSGGISVAVSGACVTAASVAATTVRATSVATAPPLETQALADRAIQAIQRQRQSRAALIGQGSVGFVNANLVIGCCLTPRDGSKRSTKDEHRCGGVVCGLGRRPIASALDGVRAARQASAAQCGAGRF